MFLIRKVIPVALVLAAGASFAEVIEESNRDSWDLSDLYPSLEAWTQAGQEVDVMLAEFVKCKDELGSSAARLRECLDLFYRGQKEFTRYFIYAAMGSDVDIRDQDAMAKRQTAGLMATRLSTDTAFVQPELLAVGEETLLGYIAAEPGLEEYRYFIENVVRQAQHTLGEEGEGVIAAAGNVTAAPFNIYSTLTNAEVTWPTIALSDTEEARIDQAGYSRYRGVINRDDRQKVFDEFWGTWKQFERTMGTTLNAAINADYFQATVREYPNSLSAAIDNANIPETVYRTLVSETNANLDTLHRYLQLRARILGIDDLRYFDIYPPLVNSDKEFPLEAGMALTLEALKPLGEDYVSAMRHGLENRWMDAYPSEGKRSGAYMQGGGYDVHPYVLMNYNENYGSVSTLAHEWGHAMHSYLAAQAQPYPTYSYSIFTAEIASTFNEALLLEHMLSIAETDEERLFYLGSALESIRGTFFRQTMFAEFELAIHEEVEQGRPLTGQRLTEMYADILKRYHGHDESVLTIDDAYTVEWAYIPHFYFNFYVYQYATSIAAASLLAQDVLSRREGALDNYLGLLAAGGSDYPYELLKGAGVDMATPEPYRATIARMNKIMDQIEKILDRQQYATNE